MSVEAFHRVVGIPVAGYQHLPAVQFDGCCRCTLLVQAAKTVELMRGGVVHFNLKTLADAEIILKTSCQQYLARLQNHRKTAVVGIDGLKQMPLAIFEIFSSGCQYEAGGMSANNCYLAIGDEYRVSAAWNVQIGQAFGRNLYNRTSRLFCLNGSFSLNSWG